MRSVGLCSLVSLALSAAAGVLRPGAASAQVSISEAGGLYTIDGAYYRLQVDAAGGGRITSWVLKPSGREMIALWKGSAAIGGALDDRAYFTAARYDAAVMQPGPDQVVLRLEARHPSGMGVLKILTARRDSPALEVAYAYRNGTQAPQQPFIRSFFLPGTRPQTADHLYWVNADPAGNRKPVVGAPDASEYYRPIAPEYAALWDRRTGDGILAFVPGADQFYFWRGSQEFPTFEWLYPSVPAGKVLQARLILLPVASPGAPPDWRALCAEHGAGLVTPTLGDVPGWVDESTRFRITASERARGFWLSIGADEGRRRLPAPLPLDLACNDDRYAAITVRILRDLQAPLRVEIPPAWRASVQAFRETSGQDRRELLPFPARPLSLRAGEVEVVWLRIGSHGRKPGEHQVPLALWVGGVRTPLPVRLRVWPVTLRRERPFHVRGYYSGLAGLAGGYEVTPSGLASLEALLKAYAEMGGDVLDWLCNWAEVVPHVELADTGESLADVAKTAPHRLDLERLPRLDFSYYDPWFDMARRYGVVRVETYLDPPGDRWQWGLLDPAVGAGRVKVGTPEASRVIVWFYREMKRHFQARGFQGFFCKISDEISPEHIPSYVEAARLAREAGWRPFTTVTGMIARTADDARRLDPHCDQWQLSFLLKDDFLAFLRKRFVLEEKRLPLNVTWGAYTNGGAEATWAAQVFGEGSVTGWNPAQVERVEVIEDGKALLFSGDSPWGNRRRGIAFSAGTIGPWLYVSPADGADPATHRYEVRAWLRRESSQGRSLLGIDRTDEVWCYGGGSHPYRGPYHEAWTYPIMALHHGFQGYGQWAYYWWQLTERIVWVDSVSHGVTVSPAYLGYRDGYRDAQLLWEFSRRFGRSALARLLGEGKEALIRTGWRAAEVYRFTTVLNAGDPLAINEARRRALQRLAAAAQPTLPTGAR